MTAELATTALATSPQVIADPAASERLAPHLSGPRGRSAQRPLEADLLSITWKESP